MGDTIRRKTEIRAFMRDARMSLRELEDALKVNDLTRAVDMAAQASGCAGEAENILRDQEGDDVHPWVDPNMHGAPGVG